MQRIVFVILATTVSPIFEIWAQDESELIRQGTYSHAEIVIDPEPDYPDLAWLNGWEGWVTYSYIITEEGKVASLIIEESTGHEDFVEAVERVVPRRFYKPATLNGVPVPESVRSETFVFDAPLGNGVRRGFRRSLEEVDGFIAAGDLQSAGRIIEELGSSQRDNLYEDAWYWWTLFLYSNARGDVEDAELITLLRRATGFGTSKLPLDTTMAALEAYYVLRLNQNNFGSAIRLYEVMRDAVWAKRATQYQRVVDTHAATYERILTLRDENVPVLQRGRIGDRGSAVHELWRRVFYITDVSGSLDTVSIRCDLGNSEHAFLEESVWRIPEEWGRCDLYLLGESDTTYGLVELQSVE